MIAGGAVRAVVDLVGIKDVVSKSLGSSNKLSVARATVAALAQVKPTSERRSTKPVAATA